MILNFSQTDVVICSTTWMGRVGRQKLTPLVVVQWQWFQWWQSPAPVPPPRWCPPLARPSGTLRLRDGLCCRPLVQKYCDDVVPGPAAAEGGRRRESRWWEGVGLWISHLERESRAECEMSGQSLSFLA